MASRSRLFSKIAKDVGSDGNLTAAALSPDVSFGATVYDSTGVLPYVGNDTGDQAYVKSTNRFYIWDSAGWYNVALINRAPTISSVLDSDGASSPFALSIDGTATTITITATDSDGDPLTYTATADADFNGLATVTGSGNEFTITPYSSDSATTSSGTITFKATDGINISSDINTFTLNFISSLWDETVLSIGTSSTNSLNNTTFIDKSTNSSTITGTAAQSSFHPYLDNYSVEFDGNDHLDIGSAVIPASGDFTVEFWYMSTDLSHRNDIISQYTQSIDGRLSIAQGSSSSGVSFFNSRSGSVVTTTIPKVNEWNHFAYVRDGDTFRVFVNGAQEATGAGSGTIDTATNTFIGFTTTQNYTEGYISDVRISSIARYDASGYTVPTEKLTADADTELLTCQSNRFIDNSTNGHTITPNSTPRVSGNQPYSLEEYTPGQNKGSGYNGYAINNSGTILDTGGTSNFTYETWIYARSGLSVQRNVFKLGSEKSGRIVFEWNSGNGYRIKGDLYGVTYYTWSASSTNVKVGEWQHFAIVRNGTIIRIYVNGIDTGQTWNLSENVGNDGGYVFGSSDTTFYMADSRLTLGTALYTSNFTPPTSPVGVGSSDAYVTYDNPGIYDKKGSHALVPVGNSVTSTTKTKYAVTSTRFAAANDYLITNGLKMGGFDDVTIEGWFNFDFTNSNVYIAGHDTTYAGNNNMYQLGLSSGRVAWWIGGSLPSTQYDPNTLSTNIWYHLAWVKDGTSYKIYKDGTQVASFTNSAIIQTHFWRIGNTYDGATQGMTGYMEDFQILNYAKYTANFTPPTQTQGRTYQAES